MNKIAVFDVDDALVVNNVMASTEHAFITETNLDPVGFAYANTIKEDPTATVVFISDRSVTDKDNFVETLNLAGLSIFDEVICRKDGDCRSSAEVKSDMIKYISDNYGEFELYNNARIMQENLI